jgi:hypothetical protein
LAISIVPVPPAAGQPSKLAAPMPVNHACAEDEAAIVRTQGRPAICAHGRSPQATNGSFVDAEHEGSGSVIRRLRSASMGWYGSRAAGRSAAAQG